MKRILIFSLLSLLLVQGNAQNSSWQKGKSGRYEYQMVTNDPMKARYYKLANGLTVILSVNKEKPRIQTIIATKAGSKTDPSDHTGLAHYLEHMLFKGTDRYGSLNWTEEKKYLDQIDSLYEVYNHTSGESKRTEIYHLIDSVSGLAAKYSIANEYDKMMSMIGAQGTNAFTDFEQTAYINDIPSNQIERWLKVEAERFRNPVLRIFHTELEAVYEEKNRGLDDDDEKVYETLFAQLFQKHNYGLQTTIGTIEHLKNPSLKAIREYFYKNYVPNNMCVVMAGDFNPDSVIVKIDQAFSYMKPHPVPEYTFEKEQEISSPRISSVYGPDAEYLNMAFRFPGANSKEAMMLELMSNVLSNGSAGLLDLNLVKKQQVLSASAGAYQLKDYSVLFLEGKARIGQDLENVKERLLEQIAILRTGQFDEAILKSIINNYRKSLIQQQESNTGRAFSLLRAFTSGVEWDRQVAAVNEMSKLTKKDIVAFCNKWLNNNYVCVYKRNGTDSHTQKIVKPAITPVEVNREAQSEFLKSVAAMEARDIQPKFVDFKKDIQSHTFSSNAQQVPLLLVPNITNRLFTQYYYIEAGSMHNKLFPIAMEYLQYLGTDRYSADEISQKFYALACEFGINAAQDESYVYLNGLQENYADGLALFEHLLKNCKADPRALHQMIEDMKKKRSDQKLNRNSIRAGLRYYAQYGARNPFNNVLSNAELDGIKADELIRILHSLTSYPHQILYYGPATLPELTKTLSIHHPLVKQFTPLPVAVPYTFTRQTSNEVLFADYDMVQAEIQWFRNGNVYDPKKVPVMTLFNEYFGGNMSGIVFQEIRESKALAYSTYATVANPRKQNEPVYSLAYVGCQADKMKEAVDGMQELLNHLPASEKLFSNSQKSIRNSISVNRVTKTDLLFNYLNARRKGLDHDLNKDVLEQVSAMTFKDIDQFHRQQLSNQMYTLAVLGSDSKMNWDILNRFGTVKKLTLEQIFGY